MNGKTVTLSALNLDNKLKFYNNKFTIPAPVSSIVCSKDFKTLEARDAEGNVTKLDMPETSNVLQYFTAAGDKVSVRPSGTEPKIKFYMEAKGTMATRGEYLEADAKAVAKIEEMKKALGI
jgi:phosphoglucomutase